MRRDNEIIRKGGINLKTPSFNLIRAAKKFNIVPNPIGIVKRKGETNKMEMGNKLSGDDYVKCLCESLKISEHLNNSRISEDLFLLMLQIITLMSHGRLIISFY